MTQAAPFADRTTSRLVFWALVVLAMLLSVKYFPGLEATGAYAGNVFQSIYPDAFPRDPYIGAERSILEKPLQLSLFYLAPKVMGEIWLDDRFAFAVYLLLVLLGMVGIDRIVTLANITEFAPRLIVQLIFMRDHQYLTLTMTFANQPDLNHAAFAIPATIWLIYVTLARQPIWLILGMGALLAAFSIRMAPYVIAFCLIIAALNGNVRDRVVIGCVFAAALAVFIYVVLYTFPVPSADRLVLWDLMLNQVEKFDSNPFYPRPDLAGMLKRNVVFVVIAAGALLAPVPGSPVYRGMKVFVALGLVIWLVAGLYYTFAPDALKLIHVMPFSAVRSLRWPQTVAYLVIMLSAFHWLASNRRLPDLAVATLVFLGLLVVGPDNHELWAGLFLVSALTVVAGNVLRRRIAAAVGGFASWLGDRYPMLLAQTLALTIVVAFASTIWRNLPYWQTWAAHGVYGNSLVAQWIGIAEYLRQNTPTDAVILPLEEPAPGKIRARRHLASRSGRAIAVMMEYSSIFDLKAWQFERDQHEAVRQLGTAVVAGDWRAAAVSLEQVMPRPDYVVIPEKYVDEALFDALPLTEETRIRGFAILKRKALGQ